MTVALGSQGQNSTGLETILASVRRFLAWATTDNVGTALDLALKLAGIVAALAIANLFQIKGQLAADPSCWTPLGLGDVDVTIRQDLNLTSSQAAIPIAALRALRDTDSNTQALGAQSPGRSMKLGCSEVQLAATTLESQPDLQIAQEQLFGHPLDEGSLSPSERKQRARLVAGIYQRYHYGLVPEIAVIIAADQALDVAAVRRVLLYIEARRHVDLLVNVSNYGKASVDNVTVPTPHGYTLIDSHPETGELPTGYKYLGAVGRHNLVFEDEPPADLAGGQSEIFIFEQVGGGAPYVSVSAVAPTGNAQHSVDVSLELKIFGLLVLLIVVPLVIRDIRRTSVARPASNGESSTGQTPPAAQ